jgi:hypothetical protein
MCRRVALNSNCRHSAKYQTILSCDCQNMGPYIGNAKSCGDQRQRSVLVSLLLTRRAKPPARHKDAALARNGSIRNASGCGAVGSDPLRGRFTRHDLTIEGPLCTLRGRSLKPKFDELDRFFEDLVIASEQPFVMVQLAVQQCVRARLFSGKVSNGAFRILAC